MPSLAKQFSPWLTQPFLRALVRAHPKAEVYIVGGAVRDALLGRPWKDADLVVRNVSKPALERFLASRGRVNLVGRRFGVFKFKPRGWSGAEIDIALPRTEHTIAGTGAYRDFRISSKATLPITDDLSRRDFTINAMAAQLDLRHGRVALIDPFGGQADLAAQRIRTVGKPDQRFAEDYSRMLRAVRFACQLDFTIEPKTRSALKRLGKRIVARHNGEQIVANEIIASELTKALVANPVRALDELDGLGFVRHLLPELLAMKRCPQPKRWHREGDVWKHTRLALAQLRTRAFRTQFSTAADASVVWSILFHDTGKPGTLKRSDRLRFNGHDMLSARLWRAAAERLKLAAAGVDVKAVEQAIAKHMLLATANVRQLKHTTLEKYFFNPNFPGTLLLMQMYADIAASLQENNKPNFTNYRQLQRRIHALSRAGAGRTLPPPILDGNDIQHGLGLAQGPRIGELIALLREAQLRGSVSTKTEALRFVRAQL